MLPLILKAVVTVYVPRTSLHVKVISHKKNDVETRCGFMDLSQEGCLERGIVMRRKDG